MLSSLTLLASAAVLAVPCEYHVDFATCPMGTPFEFDCRLTAWNRDAYDSGVHVSEGATPEAVRQLYWSLPEDHGWRGELAGKWILVVRGSKKGAIRSVEVTGDGWKPTVRWVPLVPQKK